MRGEGSFDETENTITLTNPQDRIDADKRKDENLKKEGWKLLRINWSYVCNNTQDSIKQIVDFLK